MKNKNNITKNIKKLRLINKEIKIRSQKNKISKYNTGKKVHLKQLSFHKSLKRNRWIFGGNRSGKTECGAVESVWLITGTHPFKENKPDVVGWVVSVSRQVQREVAQRKILEYLNPDLIQEIVMIEGRKDSPTNGIVEYIIIKNSFGGLSQIEFKSCDQGREKFQGASVDFVWFDEEPPLDIYQECRMRVLDRQGEIFGTMTPLKGLTWVYDTIYMNKFDDPEVEYLFMEWADNPFLNKKEIEQLSKSLALDELESRRYGKFGVNGGLVYSEFDESLNVIEPFEIPKDWYDMISIDPGLHNPLSAHFYAQDFDGNIYVIAEHYQAGWTVEQHAEAIKKICKQLDWHVGFNGFYNALIDSASSQRTLASSKSVTELFYDNGILVNPNVDKNLFSGISKVKSYIKNASGERRLFIFKNCTNLIREIKGYFWGEHDVPLKKDDHALDELRYYIMSKQTKLPKGESLIVKNKKKLMRQKRINSY